MANGLGQPGQGMDVVGAIMAKVQEFDKLVGETRQLVEGFDPSLLPLFKPIGEAVLKIAETVQTKSQRSGMAQGSPAVPPQPPASPATGPMPPPGM